MAPLLTIITTQPRLTLVSILPFLFKGKDLHMPESLHNSLNLLDLRRLPRELLTDPKTNFKLILMLIDIYPSISHVPIT